MKNPPPLTTQINQLNEAIKMNDKITRILSKVVKSQENIIALEKEITLGSIKQNEWMKEKLQEWDERGLVPNKIKELKADLMKDNEAIDGMRSLLAQIEAIDETYRKTTQSIFKYHKMKSDGLIKILKVFKKYEHQKYL